MNTEALVVGFTWQGLRGRTVWDQSWQTAQEAAGLCPLVSGRGGLVPPVLELDFQALAASSGRGYRSGRGELALLSSVEFGSFLEKSRSDVSDPVARARLCSTRLCSDQIRVEAQGSRVPGFSPQPLLAAPPRAGDWTLL